MKTSKDWFKSWFDTKWYHTLYCNRDEREAQEFIRNLMKHLQPAPGAKILDLACGKGRHSLQINKLGYEVWGIDLSEQSIKEAQKQANESLHFDVHDMRKVYKPGHFQVILNLFTSFGYFNDPEDNLRVMKSVCDGLVDDGIFVLDFLNARKVKDNLVPHEVVDKGEIQFSISRKVEQNVIVKTIEFETEGEKHNYEERVTAFELEDLKALFQPFHLDIKETFGSYDLQPFECEKSDRLILVAEKAV